MSQDKVTLNEIMTAVRELTFDRFIIPAFAVKEMGEDYFITVDKEYEPLGAPADYIKGRILITKETADPALVETIVELPFNDYPTLNDIMEAFIEEGIVVAYTAYFRGQESSTSLLAVKKKSLELPFTAFKRYFFTDEEILEVIRCYYARVLHICNVDLTDEQIGKLHRPSEKHLIIWVSYMLVDKRRLYENAAAAIGQSYTDGSDYVGGGIGSKMETTTVQIGSVFTINEDPLLGYTENSEGVGSDNVWGDRYSFWYRLMLYLRGLLEEMFGDYSLRKDTVMPGRLELENPLNFRAYYDSYPFTLSPLSRGILSKVP